MVKKSYYKQTLSPLKMPRIFIVLITIITTAVSCSVHSRTYQTENEDTYLIKKIKKKNDWYFIYAAQNDEIFLICSREPKDKISYSHYPKVLRNSCYQLSLESFRFAEFEMVGRKAHWNLYVTEIKLDSITEVCIDQKNDGFYTNDIYFTDDLKGLYYVREKQ